MRAIVTFKKDITPLIPVLSKVIPRCNYDSGLKTIMFRSDDKGIFIEPDHMKIYNAGDEAAVESVLAYLKRLMQPVE